MAEERLEDVVIAFDVSRSMFRRDFAPNRIEAVKKAIEAFVRRKYEIDYRDRVALVAFSSKGKVAAELTNEPDYIIPTLQPLKALGTTGMGEGLAVAIQLLVKEIQLLGQKVFRIIVISDGKPWGSTIDPFKMTTLASHMKIIIDTIGISELGVAYEESILEKIAVETKGEYSRVFETQSLIEVLVSLANKKQITYSEAQRRSAITDATVLKIIAGDLFRPAEASEDQTELINLIVGREKVKCIICYQYDCQTCHGPFFSCGRFCSNCKAPMHLHCAAGWAENSPPENNPNIFRCPRCFFLLKVPETVHLVQRMHQRHTYDLPAETETTRFALITRETEEIQYASCPVCHMIFDFADDPRAYLCTNCGSYFHAKCLEDWLARGEGACRVCGKRIEM
ncbi:MAG: VWA domain-containing protein [Candidatus Helarchaeota archaeon]|nr:VWA domain-containing protein [Candidatus Helarchaeota archaeon]